MPPAKKSKKDEAAAKAKAEDEKKKAAAKEEKSEEEESEDESEEEENESDNEDRGRGKRKRKSSIENAFEPVDFTLQAGKTSDVVILQGRGKKLKEFPTVVASVEKHSTDDVLFAHKFLYGNRGSHLKKKDLIHNILEFSGYLKVAPKGYDPKKLDAEDEVEETKFSKKAFKLFLPQVKMLCNFFDVEDKDENSKPLNKEDMIENLLDFLTQPNADFLKAKTGEAPKPKKKKATPKKKTASKAKSGTTPAKAKPAKEPFHLVRSHKKGKNPSDDALRQWVRAYVVCFDMDTATTKHAIKTASDKFGVDLTGTKDRIKELLAEEM